MFVGHLIWIPLRYFLTNTAKTFYACWQAQSNQEIGFLSWLDKGRVKTGYSLSTICLYAVREESSARRQLRQDTVNILVDVM